MPSKIPFGKHKGKPIDKLPTDYLKWLISLGDDLDKWDVAEEIRQEFARRRQGYKPPPKDEKWEPKYTTISHHEVASQVIEQGYRALSKKFHPDVGGTHEEMVALNRVMEQLRSMVK